MLFVDLLVVTLLCCLFSVICLDRSELFVLFVSLCVFSVVTFLVLFVVVCRGCCDLSILFVCRCLSCLL